MVCIFFIINRFAAIHVSIFLFGLEGNLVIIDVREPEEIERDGFISGKVNIPSSKFKDIDRAKSILLEHKDKDEIVVHCLKSQQRGPTCALALSQALEELHTNGVEHPLPLM